MITEDEWEDNMTISVLMATYNGEKFIEKQLKSIHLQTMVIDEVIICDDCSEDNTVRKVKQYIQDNQLQNWKIIVNERNLGHYQTFLKLCRLNTSDYVFFSDQDDIWEYNKVECLYRTLINERVAMVYGQSAFINDSDVIIRSKKMSGKCIERHIQEMLTSWPSGYQMAIRAEMLNDVLKKRYDKLVGYDFHDVLFSQLACLYGKVIQIDSCLDYHRLHETNATISINSQRFKRSVSERIIYLEKVKQRYQSALSVAKEKDLLMEVEWIDLFVEATQKRIDFLKQPSIQNFIRSIAQKNVLKKDRLSDVIYAWHINNLVSKFRK